MLCVGIQNNQLWDTVYQLYQAVIYSANDRHSIFIIREPQSYNILNESIICCNPNNYKHIYTYIHIYMHTHAHIIIATHGILLIVCILPVGLLLLIAAIEEQ